MNPSGAVGFPVNLPANFASAYGSGVYGMPVARGATPNQIANQNNAPIPTLYVRNLKDSLKDAALRKLLREKFGEYGKLVSVDVSRSPIMRGQAFLSFEKIEEATAAKEALDGKELRGKMMVVQFAKTKSDRLAKQDGTYVKRQKIDPKASVAGPRDAIGGGLTAQEEGNEPHNILFVQNLPAPDDESFSADEVFGQFAGFVEVRRPPGKNDLAFVEYGSVSDAASALKKLRSFAEDDEEYKNYVFDFAKK